MGIGRKWYVVVTGRVQDVTPSVLVVHQTADRGAAEQHAGNNQAQRRTQGNWKERSYRYWEYGSALGSGHYLPTAPPPTHPTVRIDPPPL